LVLLLTPGAKLRLGYRLPNDTLLQPVGVGLRADFVCTFAGRG